MQESQEVQEAQKAREAQGQGRCKLIRQALLPDPGKQGLEGGGVKPIIETLKGDQRQKDMAFAANGKSYP